MSLISTLALAADTPSAEFATIPGCTYTLEVSALCMVEVKTASGDWIQHYQPTPLTPSDPSADRAGSFIAPTLFARVVSFALPVNGKVYSGVSDGALTDSQLRASAVPVSGPLSDAQLRASAVPVSGPLSDTQLRASSVNTKDQVGASGGAIYADTTVRSGLTVTAIQILSDAVFTTLTGNLTGYAGVTIPTGTVLRGSFTAITLASGTIVAYA